MRRKIVIFLAFVLTCQLLSACGATKNEYVPEPPTMNEVLAQLYYCRTFFYSGGDCPNGEHSVVRIDLNQDDTYEYISETSHGIKISDIEKKLEREGTYTVELDSDGVYLLKLDEWRDCPILFDENGTIIGVYTQGFADYEGNVDVVELKLTDKWKQGG